jgi:hypothetical protein
MLPKIPDISSLPVEQQVIAWVVFSLISILAFVVGKWAFNQGKKAAGGNGNEAQVAAVIVDPSALNRATAAIEALNFTQIETNMIHKQHNEITHDLREAIDELAKQIEILRSIAK